MSWTNEDFEHLLELVQENKIVLVADTSLGLPTIHEIPNPQHIWMGMFDATNEQYTIEFEGGGAMSRTPSGKGYTVVKVLRGVFPYNCQDVATRLEELIEE